MARKWQKIAAMKRKRISLPRTDEDSMISPKNLIRIARKWQKVAALGRKRILLQRFNRGWMQTAVAHHQWLIRAILLFTVLIDDVL
uniref:Uncharacterized protein n=1 Tax=Vitis vinifera TaxID=29760 RepID=F6I0U5_VITVI